MKNIIDLRSDTITKPTKEMLEAMFSAKVGDDVFGDDPAVNALQEKVSSYIWKRSCIILPIWNDDKPDRHKSSYKTRR